MSDRVHRFVFALAFVALVTTASSNAFAKSWWNITPLHSTAEDVRKLFPDCGDTKTRCQFRLEDQDVMVIFSGSTIGVLECNRVPKGMVLAVIVKFRSPRKLQDFKLQRARFTTFDPSEPPKHGYKAYHYRREGLIINTYEGKAIALVDLAVENDIPLCPEYYDDPKAFVAIGLMY